MGVNQGAQLESDTVNLGSVQVKHNVQGCARAPLEELSWQRRNTAVEYAQHNPRCIQNTHLVYGEKIRAIRNTISHAVLLP